MKKSINCFILVFSLLTVLPCFSLDNPYNSGGSQYGGDSLPEASFPNQSSSSNLSSLASSPYQGNSGSSSSYPNSTPLENSSTKLNDKPWEKVGNWFQKKQVKPTGQPEVDLANQRIQAGKARIKAVKAREKLDKHIADCKLRTEELTAELQRSEEQATLLENQVKFQEANLSSNSN